MGGVNTIIKTYLTNSIITFQGIVSNVDVEA
jgi:hypothetical protein